MGKNTSRVSKENDRKKIITQNIADSYGNKGAISSVDIKGYNSSGVNGAECLCHLRIWYMLQSPICSTQINPTLCIFNMRQKKEKSIEIVTLSIHKHW